MSGGTFGWVDRLGTGELLPTAREKFEHTVVTRGWESVLLPWAVKDKLGPAGFATVVQAYRYQIRSPDRERDYISPLTAKTEAIEPEGRPWFSVSERVAEAANQYGSYVVFTYIAERGTVYVTDTRNSRPDEFGGPYLRFGQRYRGWYLSEAAELGAWLDDAGALQVQTRFPE